MTGIIDSILKSSLVQKYTRLKICNILVAPTSLYGRESWAMREQNKSGTTRAEMKFMRRTPEYIWQSYKTNKNILSELKINPVVKKIRNYRKKWKQHIWRWTETYSLHGASRSWEANRFSASYEFPRILWNQNVHYRLHKCPKPGPIWSGQTDWHT
jgi:hypothetical protein